MVSERDQGPEGAAERTCHACGAPLSADQDWCLNCGAGRQGSLSGGGPGWRTAVAVGGSVAVLLGGTAVAAVAALNHHSAAAPPAVAQATTPAAPSAAEAPPGQAPSAEAPASEPPASEAPPATTTPAEVGTLATPQIELPKVPPKKQTPPPKIPLESPTPPPAPPEASEAPAAQEEAAEAPQEEQQATPSPTGEAEPHETHHGGGGSKPGHGGSQGEAHGEGEEGGGGGSEGGAGGGPGKSEAPEPLVLDTDAAAPFNPYRYPASGLGDAQLAIDGSHTTAWTAMIEPAAIPAGEEVSAGEGTGTTEAEPSAGTQTTPEEPGASTTPTSTTPGEEPARVPTGPAGIGLTLDLEQPQSAGRLLLSSSTPGMTFAVYAADGRHAPTSAPGAPGSAGRWTRLAGPRELQGKDASVKLRAAGSYRWVLVWIVRAPEDPPAGRPTGQVSVNEVELLP